MNDSFRRQLRQQRHFVHALRPLKPHRRAIRNRDVLGPVLVALQRNVFGRVTAANNEKMFSAKLARIAEIVCVQHAAGKLRHAGKLGHVRHSEVARSIDNKVKLLDFAFLKYQSVMFRNRREEMKEEENSTCLCANVTNTNNEFLLLCIPINRVDRVLQMESLGSAWSCVKTTFDVVGKNFAWWKRRNRLFEVLIKRIICHFKNFFWTI